MRKILLFSAFCLSASCNNSEVNESLLQPNVQTSKKFLTCIKENNKSGAMDLISGYNMDDTSSEYNNVYDAYYTDVYNITKKYGVAPVNEWKTDHDELHSLSGNYIAVFDEVLIPLNIRTRNDSDPVYLYIGFEKEYGEKIQEFGIIVRSMIDANDGTIDYTHLLSPKQLRKLQ